MTCSRQRTTSRLYVRRVFKIDFCDELVPAWLKCVEDVFDSEDLPLNTSRETLHQPTFLRVAKRHLVRPCLDMFAELAMQKCEHLKFTSGYPSHRAMIAELLLFQSKRTYSLHLKCFYSLTSATTLAFPGR